MPLKECGVAKVNSSSAVKTKEDDVMSDAKKERPVVPAGETEYVTTTQLPATDKGFVGYETTWKSFQKEVKYQTPKKP